MVHARKNPQISGSAYGLFNFQMAILIAREIVNLRILAGYLPGTLRPETPPCATVDRSETQRKGGVGRYRESITLGGVVACYADTDDPLGVHQVGTPLSAPGWPMKIRRTQDILDIYFRDGKWSYLSISAAPNVAVHFE
jgi:hypothetical protein